MSKLSSAKSHLIRSRENLLYIVFSVLSVLFGFITNKVLSDSYDVLDFGRYSLLMTYIGIFTFVGFPGFDVPIQKSLIKFHSPSILFFFYKAILPFSWLLLVIVFMTSRFSNLDQFVLFTACLVLFLSFVDKSSPIMHGLGRTKIVRYIELAKKALVFFVSVLGVYFAFTITQLLYAITFTLCAISLFGACISLYFLKKDGAVSRSKQMTHFMKDGFFMSLVTGLSLLGRWADNLILGYYSLNALAYFHIGKMIPQVIKEQSRVIVAPTIVKWSRQGEEKFFANIIKYKLVFWALGIALFVMTMSFSFAIPYIFPEYEESKYITQLLAIPIVYKLWEAVSATFLLLGDKTKSQGFVNMGGDILKLILICILVPTYHIEGAITAILVSDFIRFLVNQFMFLRTGTS